MNIIIITGYSGSGKSTAIAVLEDAGYYCVDNMPVDLLPKFLELPIEAESEISGLGFVMDLREKGFLSRYPAVFQTLRKKEYNFKILFLEAGEEILVQRYSQTRRQHPLAQGKSLLESIRAEKEQLKGLRKAADQIVDTSRYNVHELKSVILGIAETSSKRSPLKINILSFGFKYGVPHDADLVMDVRFLENPYFVPELKDLDGETDAVRNFVMNNKETKRFLEKFVDLLDYLIPLYEKEGKAYLTIAVGCTGGMHRSVAVTRSIFEHINKTENHIELIHRDIGL
ncbi:RNase adapter RapZ [Thermodesulfobacteriota bacterium]